MKKGPVFGMACFTGTTCVIENIAMSGLDFIYLDLEHTNYMLDEAFEKQIMAAKLHDISVLVRMADDNEVAIRKVLEWGADGVVIPHCKTAEMARRSVEGAKFAPLGRRGGETNVRAAGFGYHNFDWNAYIEQQNRDTLVIPMDEDFEFTDNIDEILDVPGIDAVNFGPIDYAVSKQLKIGYSMGEEVHEAYKTLVAKCRAKGLGVLGPVVPPTQENLKQAIADGYNMIILGNDMWHFQKALKELVNDQVAPVRKELLGVVTVREMLLTAPETIIDTLMDTNPIHVHTHDDQEEIAKMFSRYDMLAMPVVDSENRIVGIITIDDAVDVIQDENTEDFEKMAGMTPSDDTYLRTPVITLAKHRIIWLMVLMLSAMVTGAMLEYYEAAFVSIPLLVTFIPQIMDTGGNCGSQASTMIIRGLALDEISPKDFTKAWWKEIRVALLCSIALCSVNFIRILIQYHDPQVALVVSGTLMLTICMAKSLGCILPILAKILKLDPAIMASPLITTITDAFSILVYFNFALWYLSDRLI